MADAFTSRLRLRKPEVGANLNVWAPPSTGGLNDGVVAMLDQALSGIAQIDVAAGNVTLTASNGVSDTQRPMFLEATGAPGAARNITVPDTPTQKLYVVKNSTDGIVTLKTVSGSGVAIPIGDAGVFYVDETLDDVFQVDIAGTIVTKFYAWETILCDIEDATAGDTQVTVRYSVQGAYRYIEVPAFSSTITPGGTFRTVNLVPNTPASMPAAVMSDQLDHQPVIGVIGGTPEGWVLRTPAPFPPLDIFTLLRVNSSSLANGTAVTFPHNICYPLTTVDV